MLRRFNTIKDSGLFRSFRWNLETGDFQRINLVFGTNGSGKTSLSCALEAVASDGDGYSHVSCQLSDLDGTKDRSTDQQYDDEFKRLIVFNDGYVKRNHRFDGSLEMDAVLALGQKTVEAEARLAELKELTTVRQDERKAAQDAMTGAESKLAAVYTAVRDVVVSDLSRAGGDYTSNSTYGSRVKTRFSGSHDDWALLTADNLASSKQIVASDARLAVPERAYAAAIRDGFQQEAQALLAKTPVSIVLDTLHAHPDASSWVDAGRHHHRDLDTCIFCGSPLSEDRKGQIEAHFSDEVTANQAALDRLGAELRVLQQDLDRLLTEAPDAGLLFEDLRDGYTAARAKLEEQVERLRDWTKPTLEALMAKRANVLESSDVTVVKPPVIDSTAVQACIKTHNERVANHGSLVQEAALKVERHHLKIAEADVKTLANSIVEAKQLRDAADADLRAYGDEATSMETVEGDPLPSAQKLTREVAQLLGRSELLFQVAPGGTRYQVMRNGQPAVGLSTGERTAISLVHFFEGTRNANVDGRPIVVIDDPVSSLDSNVATGISAYIWGEAVARNHIEQIFVLTHDFDLFKQWDIQIDGLSRSKTLKASHPAALYELVAPYETAGGVTQRVPRFLNWPPNDGARRKLRSTYHHAFITVVRAGVQLQTDDSLENRLNALLLYPNVIRRLLESFLAFKRPELVGNFTDIMRASVGMLEEAGYQGDPEALRLRLTRFSHTHSHDESPETDVTINPDEIGPTIAAVLAFMKALDSQHFNGLCEIVGVDPTDLVPDIVVPTDDVADETSMSSADGDLSGVTPADTTPA